MAERLRGSKSKQSVEKAEKLEATKILETPNIPETSKASKEGRKKRLYHPVVVDDKTAPDKNPTISVKRSADVSQSPKSGPKKFRKVQPKPKLEFSSSTPTFATAAPRTARSTRNSIAFLSKRDFVS